MNIIFHTPLPLDKNAKSASGIRPLRMLAAFEALGYKVDLITGYSLERKLCIEKIKNNIKQGKKYSFLYSESSTMPTILTDSHHLPLHPFMDWLFFKYCNKQKIPIGVFYRDIYWLFENYGMKLNPIKKFIAKLAYRFDLWVYQRTLTALYLPSIEMGQYIPKVSSHLFKTLPPGHVTPDLTSLSPKTVNHTLKLFYVGGISEHYQMHKLFEAISSLPSIELTVCTRETEWLSARLTYPPVTPNIKIVHLSGIEMEQKLNESDIAMLFVKPHEYWEFASPVKLYEYLGYKKPIIASAGTLAGNFIEEHEIGWVLPYETDSLIELLATLISTPNQFCTIYKNLQKLAPLHSWQSRAKQVSKDLTL